MLVLTQVGLGTTIAALFTSTTIAIVGALIFNLGMAAATLHLGKPLKAWRFFLGLKTSWLSREILAFSLVAPIPLIITIFPFLPEFPLKDLTLTAAKWSLIPLSIGAIFTSAMIYHDTRRVLWHLKTSLPNFLLTATAATTLFLSPTFFVLTIIVLLALEGSFLLPARQETWSPLRHSARLRLGPLARVTFSRYLTATLALLLAFLSPWTALPLLIISELCSRHLFFRTVQAPKMPGGLEASHHN